jgi:hypothetical protein
MADGDAIREWHRARLAAANQAIQQSVATLTSSQRAIAEARRRLSKRSKETPAPPKPKTRAALVGQMRDRLTRCRRLRATQQSYKAALARALILVKLEHGILPYESRGAYTSQPGTGGKCAACGSTVKRTVLGMMVPVAGPTRTVELHADCCTLWDHERQRHDTVAWGPHAAC